MESSVTVSVRTILLTGLVAVGLVVAYLLGAGGGSGGGPAQAAEGTESTADPAIRMTGRGETATVPDQLTFSLSVTAKRDNLEDALDDSSATLKRVFSALEEYGVTKEDTRSTGLNMSPEYHYPTYGSPVLTGYRVTQQARVEVDELAQGGKAISAAVAAGGNGVRVHSIRLAVSDPTEAVAAARDAAVADAQAKAEQYAAATGRTLGEVLTIREVSAPPRVVEQALDLTRASFALKAARDSVPIRAGTQDLTVRVQVVWSFE